MKIYINIAIALATASISVAKAGTITQFYFVQCYQNPNGGPRQCSNAYGPYATLQRCEQFKKDVGGANTYEQHCYSKEIQTLEPAD